MEKEKIRTMKFVGAYRRLMGLPALKREQAKSLLREFINLVDEENKNMFPKKEDPELILLDAIANKDNLADAIMRQEKRGQEKLVNSEVLPKRINGRGTRADLEKMGIVFGKEADDLFIYVTLPKGWKKEGTEHSSMWSLLLDETGKERASIFYKAAFYDRDAFLNIT